MKTLFEVRVEFKNSITPPFVLGVFEKEKDASSFISWFRIHPTAVYIFYRFQDPIENVYYKEITLYDTPCGLQDKIEYGFGGLTV